jgi:hypothetical protein
MSKPKIQPLIPLIRRRRQVIQLFLLTHRSPHAIPVRIPFHIIQLSAQVQEDVEHEDGKQDMVAALVARRVVFLVDVGGDDAGCLHAHVVQGCGDGARADCVGVTGVPANLDGMCLIGCQNTSTSTFQTRERGCVFDLPLG